MRRSKLAMPRQYSPGGSTLQGVQILVSWMLLQQPGRAVNLPLDWQSLKVCAGVEGGNVSTSEVLELCAVLLCRRHVDGLLVVLVEVAGVAGSSTAWNVRRLHLPTITNFYSYYQPFNGHR